MGKQMPIHIKNGSREEVVLFIKENKTIQMPPTNSMLLDGSIDTTGCWINTRGKPGQYIKQRYTGEHDWLVGAKDNNGYCHRLTYALHYNKCLVAEEYKNHIVGHLCEEINPYDHQRCCNPFHLSLMTKSQNMQQWHKLHKERKYA